MLGALAFSTMLMLVALTVPEAVFLVMFGPSMNEL